MPRCDQGRRSKAMAIELFISKEYGLSSNEKPPSGLHLSAAKRGGYPSYPLTIVPVICTIPIRICEP